VRGSDVRADRKGGGQEGSGRYIDTKYWPVQCVRVYQFFVLKSDIDCVSIYCSLRLQKKLISQVSVYSSVFKCMRISFDYK
jgi:hypothetical protein